MIKRYIKLTYLKLLRTKQFETWYKAYMTNRISKNKKDINIVIEIKNMMYCLNRRLDIAGKKWWIGS